MVSSLSRESSDKLYKFAHASNGDMMVACYARDTDGDKP